MDTPVSPSKNGPYSFVLEAADAVRPVELIEVHLAQKLVAEFLVADHEVWTMGECEALKGEYKKVLRLWHAEEKDSS